MITASRVVVEDITDSSCVCVREIDPDADADGSDPGAKNDVDGRFGEMSVSSLCVGLKRKPRLVTAVMLWRWSVFDSKMRLSADIRNPLTTRAALFITPSPS